MEQKIYDLLCNCYADSLTEIYAKLNYQLFVMSLKSMLPFENKVGCEFDLNRYKYEVETLKYYKNGKDILVDNIIMGNKPLAQYDELIEYKILPIIISNTQWKNISEQALKSIIYYTYSRKSVLNTLIIASLISEYMNNNNDIDSILQITKKRLIEFSIKSFYMDNYNISAKSNYLINFEKDRIQYIAKNSLFDIEQIKNSKAAQYIIGNTKTKSLIRDEHREHLLSFSTYLYKLRKGLMDPDKLRYNITEDISINKYLNNNSFVHSILGKCIVLKRNGNEAIVKTKSGIIKVKV